MSATAADDGHGRERVLAEHGAGVNATFDTRDGMVGSHRWRFPNHEVFPSGEKPTVRRALIVATSSSLPHRVGHQRRVGERLEEQAAEGDRIAQDQCGHARDALVGSLG